MSPGVKWLLCGVFVAPRDLYHEIIQSQVHSKDYVSVSSTYKGFNLFPSSGSLLWQLPL